MSNKDYEEIKTIFNVRRAGHSTMGNPAWVVTFSDLTFARTKSNTLWSYELPSSEWMNVPLVVTFTPAGRIRWAEILEEDDPRYPHDDCTS